MGKPAIRSTVTLARVIRARLTGGRSWRAVALLSLGLLLFAPPTRARAEPERRPQCSLEAAWHSTDARLLRIYDGLRKGLERAHLPRVCQADVKPTAASYDAWAKQLGAAERSDTGPLAFALGDVAASQLGARASTVPRVLVVPRYTIAGGPVHPLPQLVGRGSVVLLEMRVERLGEIIRSLLGASGRPVALATRGPQSPETTATLGRIAKAAQLRLVPLGGTGTDRPEALLHLRLGAGETLVAFPEAAALAGDLKIPVVTDEPSRFRQGLASVVLAGEFELAGRHAADAARRHLRADADGQPAPSKLRRVVGTRVWVDLAAADARGLKLPLPFIAGADALHRPRQRAREPAPRGGG